MENKYVDEDGMKTKTKCPKLAPWAGILSSQFQLVEPLRMIDKW